MKRVHKNKTPDANPDNNFDVLCQGFDGGSFYGLEYIIEDFFQNTEVKPSIPNQNKDTIDWFGLNS